jgi:beta-galactosidase
VTVPHDFVVEGNFSQSADMSHGYLPYAVAYYRRHFSLPADAAPTDTYILDFEGVMVHSQVWLNGVGVAAHDSGYSSFHVVLPPGALKFGGADNVLALRVDGTAPDGWWYDGAGIYRPVNLIVISTPGPRIAPWGVYAPSNATGAITWTGGAPFADSTLLPTVEVVSNASSPVSFTLALTVTDAAGAVVATAGGPGSVPANGAVV